MSDSFYKSLRDGTAAPLIKQYGMAVTLRRTTKGVYDPDNGKRAADTVTDYPCYAISDNYNAFMVANSLVRQGDRQLIVSAKELTAQGVKPILNDQFILPDGGVWTIPSSQGSLISQYQPIQTIAPGGIPVVYMVQVRE